MYARGMTVREIRGHLEELYGIDVSPDLASAVTDSVPEEVAGLRHCSGGGTDRWMPAIRWYSSLPSRVKIRDEGFVRNKAF